MKVYLAGYMSGSCLEQCLAWRLKIRNHYENWKGAGKPYEDLYFLDPFNGPEIKTISKDGLKSSIPPNAIVDGDYMSVKNSDLIIANLDTFGETRPITGTQWELAWAWQMRKPFVIITDDSNYIDHPFTSQASIIVPNVDELLDKKIINYFYKRIKGANYFVELGENK